MIMVKNRHLFIAAFLFVVVAFAATERMWLTCLLAAMGASECAYRYGRRKIRRKPRTPDTGDGHE